MGLVQEFAKAFNARDGDGLLDTGVALLQLGFASDAIAKMLGRRIG